MGALFPVKVYVPAFRQAITAEITFGFDEHKFPLSRGMKIVFMNGILKRGSVC
jgi:hypothetical protein